MRLGGYGMLGGSDFDTDTDHLYQTAFGRSGSKSTARNGTVRAVSCSGGCDIISVYIWNSLFYGVWCLMNIARLPLDKIYKIC